MRIKSYFRRASRLIVITCLIVLIALLVTVLRTSLMANAQGSLVALGTLWTTKGGLVRSSQGISQHAAGQALVKTQIVRSAQKPGIVTAAQVTPTLQITLDCGGAIFTGTTEITSTLAYTLSRSGPGSTTVLPATFQFVAPWNPVIQGLVGPFTVSASGDLVISGTVAAQTQVTRTLTCSARG